MFAEQMRQVVDQLTAGGVRAGTAAADLNPPAVLVVPPVVTPVGPGGHVEYRWQVLAAVPDSGPAHLDVLDDLVTRACAALGWVTEMVPTTVTMSDGPPVPGYRLAFTTDD